jgi:DNA-binding SARP family transcriptional activator
MSNIVQIEKIESHIAWYLLLLLLLPLGFFFWKKTLKKQRQSIQRVHEPIDVSSDKINYETILNGDEVRSSSITLLGDFKIIDDVGVDVTGYFTSVTTQMFLLCLLSSIKNGKGISSQELRNLLWYDKDDDSARNNRNVNASKLRVILKNLKGFEIQNNNSYWTITLGKEIFCDYKNVCSLIKYIENEKDYTRKDYLNELLNLASTGILLPNMQLECLDAYKAEYSNLVIEKLFQIMEREDIKSDLTMIAKIATVILLHDSIDEEATTKKCYALYHLGKKGKAKQCFEKFAENYRNLLDTEYKYTFNQFRENYL